MLCTTCHQTTQGRTDRINTTTSFVYNHHESAQDLEFAANSGCHLCTIIWSLLSAEDRSSVLGYWPDDGPRQRNDFVQISTISSEDLLTVSFPLQASNDVQAPEKRLFKNLKLFPAGGASCGSEF